MSYDAPIGVGLGSIGATPALIRLADIDVSWGLIGLALCFVSVYMRVVSDRDYFWWAWMTYAVVGGVVIVAISLRPLWPAAYYPVLRYAVMVALVFFATVFYLVVTAWVDEFDSTPDEVLTE